MEPGGEYRVRLGMRKALPDSGDQRSRLASLLALDLLAFGLVLAAVPLLPVGMLTRHMLAHIAVMSVIAPLAAYLMHESSVVPDSFEGQAARALLPITLIQLAVFALLHAPGLHDAMMGLAFYGPVALALLLVVSTLFWFSVIAASRNGVAGPVAALLVSGKLFCLVAVLMVFSRRSLYGAGMMELADQHAAGLLMLVACPLTYVGASTLLVARWLSDLSEAI